MRRRRLLTLFRDHGGVAAIEFAFALPILCMMVFGMYEVSQGVVCYYKMIDAANSIADLVGQTTVAQGGLGNTDFDNLYTAGQLVMSPNAGANLKLDIASVTFNAAGTRATQAWQVERGGQSAIAAATLQAAALALVVKSGSVIVVQASYSYTSALNYFITTPISMTYQTFAFPRNLPQIACPPPSSAETCN